MKDSIPEVLLRLAQAGVSVQRRDGRAVFKAVAKPPDDVIASIDERKGEITAFLDPAAVQRRLEAEAEVLRAPRPPDAPAARWEAAMAGLRGFIAAGWAAEAERLGWSRDELFRVPARWSRVDQCGAGLLIGDATVIEITPDMIGIKTASGALQSFYRKPEFDIALAYSARIKAIGLDAQEEEFQLRAREAVVLSYQAHHRCDLETAKAAVTAALAGALNAKP